MILYKYLSSERIDVLTNLKIRYTQYGAFNDPFELKPSLDKLTEKTNIYELTKKDFKTLIENTYEQYPVVKSLISKNNFIQLAISLEDLLKPYVLSNMNNVIELLPDIMQNHFNSNLGALSLSEKPDNNLMWSHYAENHFGYVIGFNSEHEYFNQKLTTDDELRHLRQIVYQDERPQIDLMNPHGSDIFLVKHSQWDYEVEWRIIRSFCDASEKIDINPYPIYLFSFPANSITTVILGYRMEEFHKEKIKELLNSYTDFSHIELFQADLDKGNFNINLVRV